MEFGSMPRAFSLSSVNTLPVVMSIYLNLFLVLDFLKYFTSGLGCTGTGALVLPVSAFFLAISITLFARFRIILFISLPFFLTASSATAGLGCCTT